MKHPIYTVRFDYEKECKRFDAPEQDIGKWLEAKAIDRAKHRTMFRTDWVVYQSRLEQPENSTHTFVVSMKPSTS